MFRKDGASVLIVVNTRTSVFGSTVLDFAPGREFDQCVGLRLIAGFMSAACSTRIRTRPRTCLRLRDQSGLNGFYNDFSSVAGVQFQSERSQMQFDGRFLNI